MKKLFLVVLVVVSIPVCFDLAKAGISVEIDIKPGSDDNKINPVSNGVITVAILSTETFHADEAVDPLSVTLEGATIAHKAGHIEDVNMDGLMDMVLHFRTQDMDITPEDTDACIEGKTYDGATIKGCDEIVVLNKSKGPKKLKEQVVPKGPNNNGKSDGPDKPDKSKGPKKAPDMRSPNKISIAWSKIKTSY